MPPVDRRLGVPIQITKSDRALAEAFRDVERVPQRTVIFARWPGLPIEELAELVALGRESVGASKSSSSVDRMAKLERQVALQAATISRLRGELALVAEHEAELEHELEAMTRVRVAG